MEQMNHHSRGALKPLHHHPMHHLADIPPSPFIKDSVHAGLGSCAAQLTTIQVPSVLHTVTPLFLSLVLSKFIMSRYFCYYKTHWHAVTPLKDQAGREWTFPPLLFLYAFPPQSTVLTFNQAHSAITCFWSSCGLHMYSMPDQQMTTQAHELSSFLSLSFCIVSFTSHCCLPHQISTVCILCHFHCPLNQGTSLQLLPPMAPRPPPNPGMMTFTPRPTPQCTAPKVSVDFYSMEVCDEGPSH